MNEAIRNEPLTNGTGEHVPLVAAGRMEASVNAGEVYGR
jgi:hypothetical protein